MSWIRLLTLTLALFCWATVSFADKIEFFSEPNNQAKVSLTPVFSSKGVAPLEGEFSLPSLERTINREGFTEITVPGMTSLGQLGRPSLPTTGLVIAVPAGYRPEIRVLQQEEKVLTNIWVAPYQAKTRCDCNKASGFAFDSFLYEQPEVFPSQFIELQPLGSLQTLRFVRVGINPLQFNPQEKSLRVIYHLKFSVRFIQERPIATQLLPKGMYHLAKNWTVNGNALGGAVLPDSAQEKLLIVSPEKFKGSLTNFIDWKTQKGLAVDYVSFEQAGGTKEALKKFIKDYYKAQKIKPTYLLLVGNSEALPPFLENTTTGGGEQVAASDYPYSLVDGNDPIPDLLYGRLLADNEQEVRTQTSRWIDYEKTPEQSDWYSKGSVIASEESGSDISDESYVLEIAKNLKQHTFTAIDEYFQGKKTATKANILEAVNEGRSWITYMGHGSGLGWASTNDNLDVNALSALSNKRLPFILDISCANADYVKHPRPFGKAWVTLQSSGQNTGAVAYYGGSVNISWDPPAIMAVGISKAHFEKPVHHLGGTVLAGQIYLSEQKGVGDEFIDNLRWYQLFGDPSMELRTATPTQMKLSQSLKNNGRYSELALKVTDKSSKPLPGVLASISVPQSFKTIAAGKTDSQGRVKLQIENKSDLTRSSITLSGYNLETLIQPLNP